MKLKKVNKRILTSEEKKEKKRQKDIKTIKRCLKIIVITWIIGGIMVFAANVMMSKEATILQKIGSNSNAVSVSINDALKIEELSINKYKNFLLNEDYKSAYNMFSKEYKNYMPFETFKESVLDIDYNSIRMTEIKQKSDYAYIAGVTYDDAQRRVFTEFMIYPSLNIENTYTMSPDKFLYSYKDVKFKSDGIEVKIDELVAYIDHFSIRGTIKNKEWSKDIEIIELCASYNETLNKWLPFKETIKAGETANIDISTDPINDSTYFYLPNKVLVRRLMDGNDSRVYVINLDEK